MRTFALLMLVTALAMSGCDADPCPGKETCGDGCMPTGADCCPNGSGYCDAGKYCGTDNMCHTSGGGGGLPVGLGGAKSGGPTITQAASAST